jgi:hypothetical protein
VITCLFNLEGRDEMLRNFSFCMGLIHLSGIPFVIVECASQNLPFHLAPSANVIQVRASSDLWQKERLLNSAIRHVPDFCTKVAWVDGDIMFENSDWAIQASEALNKCVVVQLGEQVIRLPRDRYSYNGNGQCRESFGSVYSKYPSAPLLGDVRLHGHPGYGWAARRAVLDEVGLYDGCVVNGGDHIMAHAFCGDWESPCLAHIMGRDSAWHRHSIAWAKRAYPLVRARVGFVAGTILHLWHGDLPARAQVHGFEALKQAQFDPASDLEATDLSCWRWRSSKPLLHEALVEYLRICRAEYEINSGATKAAAANSQCIGSESDQRFSSDFTSSRTPTWTGVLERFAGSPGIDAIEIGTYEGRSAVWFLENILQHETSRLTCIDPCPQTTFNTNLRRFRHKVRLVQLPSAKALRDAAFRLQSIHFAYIDGSHSAPSVLQDAILVFPLLVHGGILIFDDYLYKSRHPDRADTMPKLAIDSFVSVFQNKLKIVHSGYQFIVEKL